MLEKAIAKNRLYDQIIEKSNSQHIYKLIKRNRGSTINGTNCIKQDGEYLFLPKDQHKCFADYYEHLSKPKTDSFDNTYLELCNIRRKKIIDWWKKITLLLNHLEKAM